MHRYAAAFALLCLVAGCGHAGPGPKTQAPETPGPPQGPLGDLVAYGRNIMADTPRYMPRNVGAGMSCFACHLQSGTKARGGSLVGVYAAFPQYSARAHRVIALQDRIAECFLYSMNGPPPEFSSREMEAIVAYVAYLSAGTPVGAKANPASAYQKFESPSKPDSSRGKVLYAQKCAACHQASGAGIAGAFLPLWGKKSFNNGAGMHRLWTMASFVKKNMPRNAPNSLSDQEAYDVSAYILAQPRPRFQRARLVSWPAQPASFF